MPLISRQILQAVVLQARKLGKAVYVFSADSQGDKVAHVNYVPPALKERGVDARVWAAKISEILGGKVRSEHICHSDPFLKLRQYLRPEAKKTAHKDQELTSIA